MGTSNNIAEKTTWNLDTTHSKLGFTVKHMVVSKVNGNFNDYDLKLTSGENFEDSEIELTANIASIDTGNTDRDNHLKSADFFDAENFPKLIFKSTELTKVDDENYKLKGNLTIKDVTKPIELDVTYGGTVKDPYGLERAGFGVEGTIDRFDYNLTWNAFLETGGAVVAKSIKIVADIEVTKAQDQNG